MTYVVTLFISFLMLSGTDSDNEDDWEQVDVPLQDHQHFEITLNARDNTLKSVFTHTTQHIPDLTRSAGRGVTPPHMQSVSCA